MVCALNLLPDRMLRFVLLQDKMVAVSVGAVPRNVPHPPHPFSQP